MRGQVHRGSLYSLLSSRTTTNIRDDELRRERQRQTYSSTCRFPASITNASCDTYRSNSCVIVREYNSVSVERASPDIFLDRVPIAHAMSINFKSKDKHLSVSIHLSKLYIRWEKIAKSSVAYEISKEIYRKNERENLDTSALKRERKETLPRSFPERKLVKIQWRK